MAVTTPSLHRRRSQRESTCPICRKQIDVGEWIAPATIDGFKRKRWVHTHCLEHVPAADGGSIEHSDCGSGNSEQPAGGESTASQPTQAQPAESSDTQPEHQLTQQSPTAEQGQGDNHQQNAQQDASDQRDAGDQAESNGDANTSETPEMQALARIAEGLAQLKAAQGGGKPLKIKSGDVEIEIPTCDDDDDAEFLHPQFNWICKLAANRIPVYMVGPTGCGKTHLAAQVAKRLSLPFHFISCSGGMSEGHLQGRLLPIGDSGRFEYVRSDFVKAYEEGGVFLFDEIDAADENVLVAINAALANGKMALPSRPENPVAYRHEDFVPIAAANTFGTGADRQYVGRNRLDEATLDRFRMGTVELDYCKELEARLCEHEHLLRVLHLIREAIRHHSLERVVSTRFIRDAYVMHQCGAVFSNIFMALFSGWRRDELAKVRQYVDAKLKPTDEQIPWSVVEK